MSLRTRGILLVVITSVTLAASVQSAFAASATVYVAAGGSDTSNTCVSSSSPCASVTHALTDVTSSGKIYVAGTIQEFNATADAGDLGGIVLSKNVTIEQQPGAAAAVLEGASAGEAAPLIRISGTYTVTLEGLAFDRGDNTASGGSGGAIWSKASAQLTVDDCSFTGDSARSWGGAIANGNNTGTPTLTVEDSTFTNDAVTSAEGGAISNGGAGSGNLTVQDSTFTDDSATEGGAIDTGDSASTGVATVQSSTFSGNTATDGGAIDNADHAGTGTLTVTDSTFSGNTGTDGGAVDNADNSSNGTLTVTDSTFSGNSAYDGGAIDNSEQGNANSLITLEASTFSGDSATRDGDEIDDNEGGAIANVYIAADLFNGTCDENGSDWDDEGYNAAIDQSCLSYGSGDTASTAAGQDLGPLANAGGDTDTIEMYGDNPAWGSIPSGTSVTLDGVSYQLCSTTDQRGVASEPNAACNPGAVQGGQITNPTISATLSSAGTESGSGWWDAPVTVSFTCTVGSQPLTAACPSAQTLSSDGRDQAVTETITAVDGGSASATVTLNVDQQAPAVTISGPVNGATYQSTPPSASANAVESVSGVASVNLSTSITATDTGYLETITATALSNAGVSASEQISFNVESAAATSPVIEPPATTTTVTTPVTEPPAATAPATKPPAKSPARGPQLRLKLAGPVAGATYLGSAPQASCIATAGRVVIKSCRLEIRTRLVRGGLRETITAVATVAGKKRTVSKTFVVQTLIPPRFQGFKPNHDSVYVLPLGRAYRIVVVSRARPRYVYAAPSPAHPAGGGVPLRPDGTVHGLPRWQMTVYLPNALKVFPYWNVGVTIGKRTYVLTVRT